jgi:N-acyl homoserine lactone hydrolase
MTRPATAPSVKDMRLYYMCGGFLTFDQSVFTHMHGFGTPAEVPTPIFLIDHPAGKVLFETGLHPRLATEPEKHWGQRARDLKPRLTPEQTAERQLATLGIKPDDIRYVILSCLLPDHAGGMISFPRATFIVQFQELQTAWWPDRRYIRGYEFNEVLPTRDFKFWELHGEDLDLFGDGSVEILACPAHTRGEQAVVVRLPNTGTVVLPAGVIPQKANLERNVMTGTPRADPSIVYASMSRLIRIMKEEDGMILFHHDPQEWKKAKLAPDYYD